MTEPAITALAVHISEGSNLPVSRIVIHATSPDKVPYPFASAPGTARGTAGYFQQTSSGGSAHYVEDVTGEEHCVPEMAIAWHAPPNQGSIGIEVCGLSSYTRDQWLSPEVFPAVLRAADRTRDVAARHVLPLVRLTVADLRAGRHGICGHVDVALAFMQSNHTDPGPEFPWPEFIAAVLNAPPATAREATAMGYIHAEDPITGGHWFCNPADGSIYAFDANGDQGPTARFLGGLNGHPDWKAGTAETPVVGFCSWRGDSTNAHGNGYAIVCRDVGPGSHEQPGGDFHWYRFTGDKKYAG